MDKVKSTSPDATSINSKIKEVPEYIRQNIKLFTFIFTFIVYVTLIVFLFKKNPKRVISKHSALSIVTAIFGGFIIFMLMYYAYYNKTINQKISQTSDADPTSTMNILKKLLLFSGATLAIILIVIGIIKILKTASFLKFSLLYGLNIIILLIGITLAFVIFKTLLGGRKLPLPLQLLVDIITYIPCLVYEFIEFLKIQYSITSKPVWILLFIEALFITLKILLPKLYNYVIDHDGIKLLRDQERLDSEMSLGSFESLHSKRRIDKNSKYNYKYAISFWTYIDPQPTSTNVSYTQDTNILNYGGKPKITYNAKENEIKITTLNGKKEVIIYRTKEIPYQKWFNIVINNDGGTLDVFLDNKLVSSTPGIVPYMKYDNITIGKQRGIYGLITDVTYFNNVLTRNKISVLYNSFAEKI
jgi:hypothetical protein